MPQPLDYGRLDTHPSGWLRIYALLTWIYPLVLLASLYGQYLLSWKALGHEPGGPQDDPKYIDGASWLHPITGILLIAAPPVAAAGLLLNAIVLLTSGGQRRNASVRLVVFVLAWAGTIAILVWDPRSVLVWWFD